MKKNIFVLVLLIIALFTGFSGQVAGADDPPVHPYLYFSQEDLASLRALQAAPSHQAIWNNVKSWADAHVGDSPPAEPSGGGVWWRTADTIVQYIETMAFMFAMTDDATYADAARNWMLTVAGWNKWDSNEENGQSVCVIAKGMVFGYDVLYDYLTPAEQETLVNDIARHVNVTYNAWMSRDWRQTWYVLPVRAAGFGLAGLGLLNDHSDAANWLALGVEMANEALSRAGIDGGWYEGLSYAPYAMNVFVPFLEALKRVTGQDLFKNNDFLSNHAYSYIYMTYNGKPFQFEDCDWGEGYDPNYLAFIYKLASEYNNGYTQQWANDNAAQSVMQSYIWKDPGVTAAPLDDLPLTKEFRDLGYVIFRTGWGSDDLVFAFKSGTSRGHAHPSQNEFHIYYGGKPITCGAGYATQSPEDATWSHNCILVNGEGQGQEPGDYASLPLGTRGEIEQVDLSDPYYRYALGDATAPYDGKLSKWLRHIVFVQPNYFVIYDEVAASSAKQFDWLLHLKNMGGEDYNLSVDGDVITLAKDGVKLEVKVLEPEGFANEIVHYDKPEGRDYDYIKVRPAENTSSTQFLTVHYPLAQDNSGLPTEKVSIGNLIGAKVTDGENLDLILFSRDGNPVDEYVELGGYYQSADNNTYAFDGTRVKAQFDTYQVMRLRKQTGYKTAGAFPWWAEVLGADIGIGEI